jgi:hypothetical protein
MDDLTPMSRLEGGVSIGDARRKKSNVKCQKSNVRC